MLRARLAQPTAFRRAFSRRSWERAILNSARTGSRTAWNTWCTCWIGSSVRTKPSSRALAASCRRPLGPQNSRRFSNSRRKKDCSAGSRVQSVTFGTPPPSSLSPSLSKPPPIWRRSRQQRQKRLPLSRALAARSSACQRRRLPLNRGPAAKSSACQLGRFARSFRLRPVFPLTQARRLWRISTARPPTSGELRAKTSASQPSLSTCSSN
mmetsp:Transcript_26496/g.67181  ORF Transcript_26496/g.67181 Transcript_26496/m.67181 type:complete len:210 (+) Transcript_26496:1195-1824(+)